MNPELLEKIQKVEAPPGLLAGIEKKIEIEKPQLAVKFAWGYALACSLVFILDFSVLAAQKSYSVQENSLNTTFQFNSDNQLYDLYHE